MVDRIVVKPRGIERVKLTPAEEVARVPEDRPAADARAGRPSPREIAEALLDGDEVKLAELRVRLAAARAVER